MDNAIVHAKKDGYMNGNPLQCRNEDLGSSNNDCLSRRLVMEVKPEDVLLSSVKKSQISDFCMQKLFLRRVSGLNKTIPKQIMSLEEKYLRHCLELIHVSASRANSLSIPSKINVLAEGLSSRLVSSRSGCDALFLVSSGVENVPVRLRLDPIIGSITESPSMLNILNSPLMRQSGVLDGDINYGKTDAVELTEPKNAAFLRSSGALCVGSSEDLQMERLVSEDQNFGYVPLHKRLVSLSSTNSTFSDPSSSSSSSAYCQGMLHCSWNDGFPRYVFSVEDHREVYVTNLSKVESVGDKGLDYIYVFHSRAGPGEIEIQDHELDLVGKMRVSTSFTLCPHGMEIMETQFVSCATDDNSQGDIHTSNQPLRKNKGLSKKMAKFFRGSHSYRQRTSSKFDGSFAVLDNSLDPSQDRAVLSPSNLPPNLELAAIVVRDYIRESRKETGIGGWGLSFLKKGGHRQMKTSPVAASSDCESCRQNAGDRFTSMDVLVPAGFHGGPRTTNGGGPSSLIERWRSGGSCDCGGWDIGCPLRVLHGRPNSKDVLHHAGVFGRSNSFDLFIQGAEDTQPVIKMVNIHDGLYYIHYQSTLSALQSLSIAVAIIHSHSPNLRPKVYSS